MDVSKNRWFSPKMDGENNGKAYEQMDDLGFCPPIFGNIHIEPSHQPSFLFLGGMVQPLGHCEGRWHVKNNLTVTYPPFKGHGIVAFDLGEVWKYFFF